MTNVMGLDLSLNGTGICVGDRFAFTVKGKAADGDHRLVETQDAVDYYATHCNGVQGGRADIAGVEGLPNGASMSTTLALVHGAARVALARLGIPFVYIYPTALKLFATGDGTAEKSDMQREAIALGADDRFGLDEIDAWWVRRAVLAAMGQASMSDAQREVLSRVEWPAIVGPWGELSRKPVTKKCGHKVIVLRNGGDWLHPFTVDRCDKPPK